MDKIILISLFLAPLLLAHSIAATSYLHGGGQLNAKLEGEQLRFYHSDNLGSTRTITNGDGEVVGRQKSLPFGEILSGSEKYSFTGKELDESGLQYFGARYYDSGTGRFISTDPLLQYHSPYLYANNNPLRYLDPDGNSDMDRAAGAFDAMFPVIAPFAMFGYSADNKLDYDNWYCATAALKMAVGTGGTGYGMGMVVAGGTFAVATSPTGVGAVAGAGTAGLGGVITGISTLITIDGAQKLLTGPMLMAKKKRAKSAGKISDIKFDNYGDYQAMNNRGLLRVQKGNAAGKKLVSRVSEVRRSKNGLRITRELLLGKNKVVGSMNEIVQGDKVTVTSIWLDQEYQHMGIGREAMRLGRNTYAGSNPLVRFVELDRRIMGIGRSSSGMAAIEHLFGELYQNVAVTDYGMRGTVPSK